MNDNTFKYQIMRGLIPSDSAHILCSNMMCEVLQNNVKRGKGFPSAEHEKTLNIRENDSLFLLHSLLTSKVEEVTGNVKLYPTYYYARTYLKDSDMFAHKDRPPCQNSLTMNLGQSHNYPFFIEYEDGKYEEINLKPGDAVIYKGCEWNHYRPVFEGDWYTQVFLHWVDDSSENKELRYENLTDPSVIQQQNIKSWNKLLKGK
jgi:hypothetical protein|tara:strand:+ start:126 stop:734 length:609 start_codon:yes stop_codon:yes gene_type:complete